MNSLITISKRSFSVNGGNPHVFLSISRAGQNLGNIVFELHADKQPTTAQNFVNLCTAKEGHALAGSKFH